MMCLLTPVGSKEHGQDRPNVPCPSARCLGIPTSELQVGCSSSVYSEAVITAYLIQLGTGKFSCKFVFRHLHTHDWFRAVKLRRRENCLVVCRVKRTPTMKPTDQSYNVAPRVVVGYWC